MRESALKRRVRKELTKRGYRPLKMHGSSFSDAGLPDFLVLPPRNKPGTRLWLELKTDDYGLEPHQETMCEDLSARGEVVLVLRCVKDHGLRLSTIQGRTVADGFAYADLVQTLEENAI